MPWKCANVKKICYTVALYSNTSLFGWSVILNFVEYNFVDKQSWKWLLHFAICQRNFSTYRIFYLLKHTGFKISICKSYQIFLFISKKLTNWTKCWKYLILFLKINLILCNFKIFDHILPFFYLQRQRRSTIDENCCCCCCCSCSCWDEVKLPAALGFLMPLMPFLLLLVFFLFLFLLGNWNF